MRALVLLLCLLNAGLHAEQAALQARVHVFQAACSQARRDEVEQAITRASALLQQGCAVSLSLSAWTELPLEGWCHLPVDARQRRRDLHALASAAKAPAPRELAFFLLPSSADDRLSWALVDVSLRSACDSPQEARYLKDFGSAFYTDLAWMAGEARRGQDPSPAALLVAHEVLHALSMRGHPSGAKPGTLMADHLADMGPRVPLGWGDCARQSPYLDRAK